MEEGFNKNKENIEGPVINIPAPRATIEAIGKLIKSIKNLNRTTSCYSKVLIGLTIFMAGVVYFTHTTTQQSLKVAQEILEIASFPRVSIIEPEDMFGIIATSSKVNLVLKNEFPGTISDIFINVDYFQVFADKETRHLTVCPRGYAKNYQNESKQFGNTSNMSVYNTLFKKFSLKPLEEHKFSIDFSKEYSAIMQNKPLQADESTVRSLIKVDVNYKKSINNESFKLSKFYYIFNNELIFSLETNPDRILYNDKKNEIANFPSIIYPFKELEFLERIKFFSRPYSFLPTECLIFSFSKKENIIEY